MKQYFFIQLKRLLRIILPVLVVAAILFSCLMAVYTAVGKMDEDSAELTKFQVGIVGTAGDAYLQMGMTALESFDSSRFAVELVEMEEAAAEEAMRRGDISAFLVVPDGFMDAALKGDIMPLKFVSAAGAINLVSMLKDELTRVIEILLIESQKGIYGAGNAMHAQGLSGSKVINDISIEYAMFIFDRSNMYRVAEKEVFNGLGLDGYLLSGLCVILFMLICLTFAPVMIRREQSLSRMLAARRRPVILQVLCDLAVYLIGLTFVAITVLLCAMCWVNCRPSVNALWQGLAIIWALGTMSFFMYELASDLVSGVLLQFFGTLALCFVCGCLYPITFFPDSVQKIAACLPVGLARMQLADCILLKHTLPTSLALIGYGCLFAACAALVRKYKVAGVRG